MCMWVKLTKTKKEKKNHLPTTVAWNVWEAETCAASVIWKAMVELPVCTLSNTATYILDMVTASMTEVFEGVPKPVIGGVLPCTINGTDVFIPELL